MTDLPLPNGKDIFRRYGITLENYVELLDAQGGVCAVCGKPPTQRTGPLVVDHCHDSLAIDGLVHGSPCNRRLVQQVRRYLADPPGHRFGWTVPAENEQRTIERREAGKAAARTRRAATRQGKQNAKGVAASQGKQNGEGALSRLDQLREMTYSEKVEKALNETREPARGTVRWTGGSRGGGPAQPGEGNHPKSEDLNSKRKIKFKIESWGKSKANRLPTVGAPRRGDPHPGG